MKRKKEVQSINSKKSMRGITLIALVITIIVLLILAAVSIATLTGENGILEKATKARTETDKASAKEQVQIAVMASYDQDGKLDIDTLKKELDKIEGKGSITDTNGNFPVKIMVEDYSFEINKNGNIIGRENTPAVPGEVVTGENKEYEKNGTAVIPVGFAIVPNLDDVSEGLVISDVAYDTENQGNQFVWIPVTSGTEYKRNTSFEKTDVSSKAIDDIDYLPEGITNEEQAVRSAGGFYIARYEAGKEGTDTLVSKKGANVLVNISQIDAKVKAKTIFTDNTHVKSALISGIQWDLTMAFISSKSRVDGIGNTYDVIRGSSTRHIGSMAVAGNNEADRICNIYDLEGNASEYVAEKSTYNVDGYSFIARGGYYSSGDVNSASFRSESGGPERSSRSFRVALYVK